jgi:hypothetical protein
MGLKQQLARGTGPASSSSEVFSGNLRQLHPFVHARRTDPDDGELLDLVATDTLLFTASVEQFLTGETSPARILRPRQLGISTGDFAPTENPLRRKGRLSVPIRPMNDNLWLFRDMLAIARQAQPSCHSPKRDFRIFRLA